MNERVRRLGPPAASVLIGSIFAATTRYSMCGFSDNSLGGRHLVHWFWLVGGATFLIGMIAPRAMTAAWTVGEIAGLFAMLCLGVMKDLERDPTSHNLLGIELILWFCAAGCFCFLATVASVTRSWLARRLP